MHLSQVFLNGFAPDKVVVTSGGGESQRRKRNASPPLPLADKDMSIEGMSKNKEEKKKKSKRNSKEEEEDEIDVAASPPILKVIQKSLAQSVL